MSNIYLKSIVQKRTLAVLSDYIKQKTPGLSARRLSSVTAILDIVVADAPLVFLNAVFQLSELVIHTEIE